MRESFYEHIKDRGVYEGTMDFVMDSFINVLGDSKYFLEDKFTGLGKGIAKLVSRNNSEVLA